MTGPGPLEVIDRFAKAVEKHPGALPLTDEEINTIRRVNRIFTRIDALLWFFGWGKWVIAGIIFVATQWDRITRTWQAWGGQ